MSTRTSEKSEGIFAVSDAELSAFAARLAVRPKERVLDLFCGDGRLTRLLSTAGADVLGLDFPEHAADAKVANKDLQFIGEDPATFVAERPFDMVVSWNALHLISAPDTIASSVTRSLRTGGRFIAAFPGRGHAEAVLAAVHLSLESFGVSSGEGIQPWYTPSIGQFSVVLERQGLQVTEAVLNDRPEPLPGGENGLSDWLLGPASALLDSAPRSRREALAQHVALLLRESLFHYGRWYVDAVRLQVVARKRGE